MNRWFELFQRIDWTLFTAALTLTSVGLVAIYGISISQDPPDMFLFQKQFATFAMGFIVALGFALFDYRHLKSYGLLVYIGGALLLFGVLFFGVVVNGTKGWYRIGALSFQPVELAKMALVVYLAAYFTRKCHERLTWRVFGMSFLATSLFAGLVMLQPDFGSAMVLFLTWGIMAAFARLPKHAWLILPLIFTLSAATVWSVGLKPYQKARIESFIDPTLDPLGSGYNAIQARIAIGSGGWLGKGVGEGSQARLRFLPAAATDFIFAVVGEELGLSGVLMILGLFIILLYRFIRLGQESGDDFATLLLIGLGGIFLIHVFVNAGMNLGLMPITGIPMPFLSAAASYLMVAFIALGIAQSVAARRRSVGSLQAETVVDA